jgi:hypothetical protein
MSFRNDLLDQLSAAAKDVLLGTAGETLSYTHRQATAISLTGYPGPEAQENVDYLNLNTEERGRTFHVPAQAGLLAFVTTKALTANVATISTREAHGFVVNQTVRIVLETADSVFDGLQVIASVPTTTTFTFAKTNANIASTSATGISEARILVGDKIRFESEDYEIRSFSNAGIRALYKIETVRVQPQALGVN